MLCSDLGLKPLYANIIGTDVQNFNPITSGLDFITVQSSETLTPGIVNLGLFSNYAVNILPVFDEDLGQGGDDSRLGKTRDALTGADLNFGIGIINDLDVGFSFPFIVSQVDNSDRERGVFTATGNTEFRLNLKYRFFGDQSHGLATVFTININRTDNNPWIGAGAGPTLNTELVGDWTWGIVNMAVNLGYRLRNPGEPVEDFPIKPLGNQVLFSLGSSVLLSSIDTKIVGELISAMPSGGEEFSGSTRLQTVTEGLLGLKYDASRSLALHLGGGSEVVHSNGSPDWRIYLGMNSTIGPYWAKKKPLQVVKVKRKKKKKKKKKIVVPPSVPLGPPALPEPDRGGDEVFVLRDINFAYDSDFRVLKGTKDALGQLAQRMSETGYKKLIIEGHTDSMGSLKYNFELGKRRADAVKDYMIRAFKLDRNRVVVVTFGETSPVADNGNYQGRQLNRRVVFRLFYK